MRGLMGDAGILVADLVFLSGSWRAYTLGKLNRVVIFRFSRQWKGWF
jgi:hypothetical protein